MRDIHIRARRPAGADAFGIQRSANKSDSGQKLRRLLGAELERKTPAKFVHRPGIADQDGLSVAESDFPVFVMRVGAG